MIENRFDPLARSSNHMKLPKKSLSVNHHQFDSLLEDALSKTDLEEHVTFSNHAQKRLDQHGFTLNEADLTKLDEAVQTLADKGSKQSLILYDDLALIASVQNRKVITALKSTDMNEVTNIDSAIQVKKSID
ncbi:flagellar biosynthesis protein [Marinilactibacillus kalidii]|uniref:flagellar biosynthesis protein n=1 Tax=Marinilactibacillus kalidii TaxID=2820274 RepID=UPI001ABE9E4D|nr:flagellar biosynthesis protein [Marinilactibacillus kalidii]